MGKVKILFFAADPLSAPPDGRHARLRLDENIRQIEEKVRASEHRDALRFEYRLAARPGDLLQALNEKRPRVVHFSGHGGKDGLVLASADGLGAHPVDAAALEQLFQSFRSDVRLVVLSACFSLPQAEAIASVVGCAIGTPRPILDAAAITFDAAFYSAIGFGESVEAAYKQACAALGLERFPKNAWPQLVVRPGVDPAQLVLVSPAKRPRRERIAARPMGLLGRSASGPGESWRGRTGGLALAGMLAVAGGTLFQGTGAPRCAWDLRASDRVRADQLQVQAATGDPSGARSDLTSAKLLREGGNHAAALPLFRRAAERGSAEAMAYVGLAYMRGEGTAQRPDSAYGWLRRAAAKRDVLGMTALGAAYRDGVGVGASRRWARHWFQAAAEKLDAEAMRSLAGIYLEERNHANAILWYRNAVQSGSLEARVDAGRLFEEGQGVQRDADEARCLYVSAARAGSPRGMFAMGRLYQTGIGVPRDLGQAKSWYEKAAAAGPADAMNSMGVLYHRGSGVPPSRDEAIRWFRRARDAGSMIGEGNLVAMGAS